MSISCCADAPLADPPASTSTLVVPAGAIIARFVRNAVTRPVLCVLDVHPISLAALPDESLDAVWSVRRMTEIDISTLMEPARRQRCNTVPRGGGVARLLADVLASPVTDGALQLDGAPTPPMPPSAKVESPEAARSDPLRRPIQLATIAAGRLAMRLGEVPPPSGGAYRVQVAVTTPDGTRIEISTQVDGVDD